MYKLIAVVFSLILVVPLTAKNPQKNRYSKEYSTKKFYFSGWGAPKDSTEAEQLKKLKKWADAGITDLLPGAGEERLRELIKLGANYGIRIHAWHWMLNIGKNEECRKHPEWYSINQLGQSCRDFHPYVGYYSFLSPFSKGAREYIKNSVMQKAKIEGLASVHFDYIRYVDVYLGNNLQKKYKYKGKQLKQDRIYPEYDFGYHPNARKQYKKIFGIDPLEMQDKVENAAWEQFRMNAVTTLVEECVEICHKEGTAASAAVFPFPQLARKYVRQDWSHWNIDYIFPMIYKNDHDGNIGWVDFAVKECIRDTEPGQHLFAGILVGHYKNNIKDFEEAIIRAHKNGARGITFFTVNALTDEHLDIIRKYNIKFNH